MQSGCVDSLILSDLHLGSEVSRASEAVDLLDSISFKRLVLLGDIFSDLNFRRLTKEHWKFLSCIRKLSNPKRKKEVIWVEGNHDHGLSEVMSHLVGVPVYQQYVWEFAGKRHLAIHGHQFDRFVINNYLLSRLGEFAYLHLQKWDAKHKTFVRYLDRLNTRWLRLTQKVADGALAHGKQAQAERIFCGHTHVAHSVVRDGVEYYNCGSWVDARCTYITVSDEGVLIHGYERQQPSLYRDPGEERTGTASRPSRIPVVPGLSAYAAGESIRC
jgi:UDP-2,3-diacylglucosamine pyrophosphatase LpxH